MIARKAFIARLPVGPMLEPAGAPRLYAQFVVSTNLFVTHQARVIGLALAHRMPCISGFASHVEAGLLMSYGADLDALGHRAATYVDKILKGARAGDLPIERPTEFELVVNRKTERALGITLPPALMLRASRVIE